MTAVTGILCMECNVTSTERPNIGHMNNTIASAFAELVNVSEQAQIEDKVLVLRGLDIVLGVILIITSIAAVFLNASLIWVIAKTPALHTATNAIIISLATSDLLTGLLVLPFATACRFQRAWLFTHTWCHAGGVITSALNMATLHSLVCVSIDRCIAVTKPLKYNHIMSHVTTAGLLTFVWVESFSFAMFPAFGWGHYEYIDQESFCGLRLDRWDDIAITRGTLCVAIPLLFIAMMFVMIYHAAVSHHRVFSALPIQTVLPIHSVNMMPVVTNYRSRTMKAMRTLFYIVACFTLLRAPVTILDIISVFIGFDSYSYAWTLATWLAYISSTINPLIITALNKKFQEKFMNHVCRRDGYSNRIRPELLGQVKDIQSRGTLSTFLPSSACEPSTSRSIWATTPIATANRFRRDAIRLPVKSRTTWSIESPLPAKNRQMPPMRRTLSSPQCIGLPVLRPSAVNLLNVPAEQRGQMQATI